MPPSTPVASRPASINSKYTSPTKKQRLNDSEVESQRYESLDRLKETWDDIALRYAKAGESEDEEDDVFDLTTCSVVEDNGWLRRTEALPFGSFTLSESEEEEGGTAEESASEESANEQDKEQSSVEIEEPSSDFEAESNSEEAESDLEQVLPVRQRSTSLDTTSSRSQSPVASTQFCSSFVSSSKPTRQRSCSSESDAISSRSPSAPIPVQSTATSSSSKSKHSTSLFIEPPALSTMYRSQSPFLPSSPPTSQRSTASSLFSYHSSSTTATSPSPGPSQHKPASKTLGQPPRIQRETPSSRPSTSKLPIPSSPSSFQVEPKTRGRSTPNLTQRAHNLSIHTPQRKPLHSLLFTQANRSNRSTHTISFIQSANQSRKSRISGCS